MALQLPGLPVEEQMVDNWGQPTPFMQLRWQEMAEKLVAQETAQNQVLADLATAQTDLATAQAALTSQAAILSSQAATLSSTVSNLSTVTSNLSSLSLGFVNQNAAVALILVQIFTKVNQLIDWVDWLDTNGTAHYPGTKPGHLV